MVDSTIAGSLTGERSTNHAPSTKSRVSSSATATPSRVLPVPPAPVERQQSHQRAPQTLRDVQQFVVPSDQGTWLEGEPSAAACSTGRLSRGRGLARAEFRRRADSRSDRLSASARRWTVSGCGKRLAPRSRSEIPWALRPASSASASWLSPAATRIRRSNSPKAFGACGHTVLAVNAWPLFASQNARLRIAGVRTDAIAGEMREFPGRLRVVGRVRSGHAECGLGARLRDAGLILALGGHRHVDPRCRQCSGPEWADRADSSSRPIIQRYRDKSERQRHMALPIFDAIAAKGILEMLVPGRIRRATS